MIFLALAMPVWILPCLPLLLVREPTICSLYSRGFWGHQLEGRRVVGKKQIM